MYNMKEHYEALMELSQGDSSFYYVDQKLDNSIYRIFLYRLAGYQEFCLPYARESRGHTFEVGQTGEPIRIASFPMEKFFNYMENPFTMDLDFSIVHKIMDKEDGSLISSLYHSEKLYLKSKGSLFSSQANDALRVLTSEPFQKLNQFVTMFAENDFTVNMEYMAPDNRIVIPHQEAHLKVLNVRSNRDGSYLEHTALKQLMQEFQCEEFLVKNIADEVEDVDAFIASIPEMVGIEGYVVVTPYETVKIKTNWYSALHRAKDSVNSPKALFEVVVSEAHDDLRAAFADDAYVLSRIASMEVLVQGIYAKIKTGPEHFYNSHKNLDRKSYAILAQNTLEQKFFGIAMSLYLGKEVNYKEWMLKHYKDFGIKDEIEGESA